MSLVLPSNIRHFLRDQHFEINEIGQSDATVLITEKFVLKVSEISTESENEVSLMQGWLVNRLPIPEIIAVERKTQRLFVLMERLKSHTAASIELRKQPQQLMHALAQGLQQLWTLDIRSCPSDQSLSQKLQIARQNVEFNRIDSLEAEIASFGPNGFEDPMALLTWLEANQPIEDLVFSHGDFCLPNLFLSQDIERVTGYIDLGRAGVADKYQDIALAYRSLKHNFAGVYDDYRIENAVATDLFNYLEMTPDWDKLNYYILLDELF